MNQYTTNSCWVIEGAFGDRPRATTQATETPYSYAKP